MTNAPIQWLNDCWTKERVDAFQSLCLESSSRDAIRAQWDKISDDNKAWLEANILIGTLPLKVTGAYVVPVLSPKACRYIIQESNKSPWEENLQEREAYRIPEQVLKDTNPQLDDDVKKALYAGLAPWIISIYGRLPDFYSSVQLTRYMPENRRAGNFHIDRDANVTAVIALNEDFTGGGTTLCDGLLGELTVPKVPVGWALLFEGKRTLHKGNEVTSGTRRLMTVWMDNCEEAW